MNALTILAVDSSAKAASAAILRDSKILGEFFVNSGFTHCETLLPMIDDMLRRCRISMGEVDCFAVSTGPGSFTGIRIGVCTIKGLAAPRGVPCIGVSTLEAAAMGVTDMEGIACCVMDARRDQFYNALFSVHGGKVNRLCEDRAVSADILQTELQNFKEPVILVGDGAELCYNNMQNIRNVGIASVSSRLQRAAGVAMVAADKAKIGQTVSPEKLVPVYLRPSQAERERAERVKNNAEV